jgi:hypothetical protein
MSAHQFSQLLAAAQPNLRDYFSTEEEVDVIIIELNHVIEIWEGDDSDARSVRAIAEGHVHSLETGTLDISSATAEWIIEDHTKAMHEFISSAFKLGGARVLAKHGNDVLREVQQRYHDSIKKHGDAVRMRLRQEAELRNDAPKAG